MQEILTAYSAAGQLDIRRRAWVPAERDKEQPADVTGRTPPRAARWSAAAWIS